MLEHLIHAGHGGTHVDPSGGIALAAGVAVAFWYVWRRGDRA